jgi:4-hydroxy-tetrahydrodipicolinate synthase
MITSAELRGAWTALITPFHNGEIDETALRGLVEFQIAEDIDGLVACGSTGETPTLTDEEFARVVRITIEQTAGRVPVIAGTGSNNTRQTIERNRIVHDLGADGVLVVMPWYNRPTQAGMEAHIRVIADATTLPIVLYNVPGRTGSDLLPPTVARLATLDNVIGIKEASGSADRVSEILHLVGPDFSVISGDDALTLPMMAIGATGVVSVASNIVPGAVTALTTAAREGLYADARAIHFDLLSLFRALFVETNPVPVKVAAELLGLSGSEVRLPLVGLEEASRSHLFQTLISCRYTGERIMLGEEAAWLPGPTTTNTRVEVAA